MVNFPSDTQRVAIIGRTGSGKTQAGIWHLSGQRWDRKPWLVVNTKGDPLINEIAAMPGVSTIDLKASVGKRGIYVIQPRPDQKEELDKFLWRIWARGNCGVYVDEGYMVTGIDSFDAMLTQGRSKHIPMIVLSQRPVWMSRFVFSEADFYQLFNLNLLDDRRKMAEYIRDLDPQYQLEEYSSIWYDVAEDSVSLFSPVPPREVILETFKRRLLPKKKFF